MKIGIDDRDGREAEPLEFEQTRSGFGGLASTVGARNLLIIIVTMPFVFLLVVMTIIGVFGAPDKDRRAEAETGVPSRQVTTLEQPALGGQRVVLPLAASAEDLSSAISMPRGAEAGAISLDGDRLAVRVDTQDGAMIVIYDLGDKTVVQTVPLVEAGGSAMSVTPAEDLQEDAYRTDGVPTPRLAERKGE